MLAYSARRLGAGLVLAVVISMLVFATTQVLPGDTAVAILGKGASPEAIAALREKLGLTQPVWQQYTTWLTGFVHGDFGTSLAASVPVSTLIGHRMVNTAILAGLTFAIMMPIAFLLGIMAGTRHGRRSDIAITSGTTIFMSLPEFVTGTILVIIFAVSLRLLPAASFTAVEDNPLSTPSVLVLPVVTLLLGLTAYTARMVRAGVVDVMRADFVMVARLNGIPERRVITRYGLRNALAPTVQVMAVVAQWLIGGIVITETVFQYPGLGQGVVQAVTARDITTIQTIAMLLALIFIAINIIADVVVMMLVPKLRYPA